MNIDACLVQLSMLNVTFIIYILICCYQSQITLILFVRSVSFRKIHIGHDFLLPWKPSVKTNMAQQSIMHNLELLLLYNIIFHFLILVLFYFYKANYTLCRQATNAENIRVCNQQSNYPSADTGRHLGILIPSFKFRM